MNTLGVPAFKSDIVDLETLRQVVGKSRRGDKPEAGESTAKLLKTIRL